MNTNLVNQAYISKPAEGQILLPPALKLRLGATQTADVFEMYELAGPRYPLPHVHREHDECVYIIEGIFTFNLGTLEVDAPADSIVFIPRGVRHAFQHSQGARAICFVIPAGLEGYFRELREGILAGRPEPKLQAELAAKYDTWPVK